MGDISRRIVILGGGLSGCITALAAKKAGFEPVVVERRSFLGYEMNGRFQLYMQEKGWELYQKKGMLKLNGIKCEEEICFYQGENKSLVMKQMREAGIPCLLFAHVAGIVCNKEGTFQGISIANSFGTWYFPAGSIVDCTGDRILRRMTGGLTNGILSSRAWWVMELEGVTMQETERLKKLDGQLGIRTEFHPSRRGHDTILAAFEIDVKKDMEKAGGWGRSLLEHEVRVKASEILPVWRKVLSNTEIHLINTAEEASVRVEGVEEFVFPKTTGYYENAGLHYGFGAEELMKVQKKAQELVVRIEKFGSGENRIKSGQTCILYQVGKAEGLSGEEFEERFQQVQGIDLQGMKLKWKNLSVWNTQVITVGVGTAGTSVLYGMQGETENIGIEAQYMLGGTRTAGQVINYYYGRCGGFTERLNQELRIFDQKILRTPERLRQKYGYLSLMLMHHRKMKELSRYCLLGSIVTDVFMDRERITGVAVANEHGVFRMDAPVIVDTTGNGDVAVLAHAEYKFGDPEDGMSQTYSQWGVEEKEPEDFHQRRFVGDYDTVDTDDYADIVRAAIVAQTNNSPYYSSNPVSYREGRRIIGKDYLTLERAIANRDIEDPIAVAVSTIDNHGRTSAGIARMGFCAVEKNYRIAIPMGCFQPKIIQGMLVGGKAISVDRDTLSLVRMSADVQNAGYALGILAGIMVRDGVVEYESLKHILLEKELLPEEYLKPAIPNAISAVMSLNQEDPFSLCHVLLQKKEEVLPLLQKDFGNCSEGKKRLLLAKALAWFGDASGKDLIIWRLKELINGEHKDEKSDYDDRCDSILHGISGTLNDYWEMNQLIELAGKIWNKDFAVLLSECAYRSEAGGKYVVSAYPYYGARRDMTCIPWYERIYNLAHVFLNNPSEVAVTALETLLQKEYIGGGQYALSEQDKPLFLASYLEITLARAAYRCGSVQAGEVLKKYTFDVRNTFAKLAKRELGI